MASDEAALARRGLNVLGTPLEECSADPVTGWYRDGYCCPGDQDHGRHLVAARVTAEFLAFSKAAGNDLTTPRPEWGFPGLVPGNRWCLCASRWYEAYEAGVAPPVVLAATSQKALAVPGITLDALVSHAWGGDLGVGDEL